MIELSEESLLRKDKVNAHFTVFHLLGSELKKASLRRKKVMCSLLACEAMQEAAAPWRLLMLRYNISKISRPGYQWPTMKDSYIV